jgi:hypothetical protein
LLSPCLGQGVAAGLNGVLAELLLDAQELVVFRQLSSGYAMSMSDFWRASCRHRDVGDGPAFSLTGAM